MVNCANCKKKIGFFTSKAMCGGCEKIFCSDCEDKMLTECPDCSDSFCEKHIKNHSCSNEDAVICGSCWKELTEDDNEREGWFCEACDGEQENPLCDKCSVGLGDDGEGSSTIILCKKCIDEAYPREEKVVEKIVEKVKLVDKSEGNSSFNLDEKTEFD